MKRILLSFQSYIKKMPSFKKSVLLFLLGGCSAFSFAPYYLLFFLLIGLTCLMSFLNQAQTKKQTALFSFSFGAGLGVFSLKWITNAFLIDGGAFSIFIPVALLGFALFMGLFFMLPAICSFFFKKGIAKWLAFSSFFAFFEWVRSWIFTGFPWNQIGNIWTTFLPFLQTASLIGVLGLSLITLLFFTSFALLPKKRYVILLSLIFCLFSFGGTLSLIENKNEMVWGVHLRLVQPNIPQSYKWDKNKAQDNYNQLLTLSREKNQNITHVIWPESALPFYPDIDEVERLRLMGALRQGSVLLAGGMRIINLRKRELANSLFVFDHLANIIGYYDKSHLVPFGEYVPFREVLKIDKIVPIPADFKKGSGLQTLFIPKAPPVSPLVCYEVIFSGHVVNKEKRPEWLLNITNDAWYGISAGPYQHLSIAQMRAVEEGLPLVRATNNGVSAVINPYGEIIASLPLGKQGVLDTSLPRSNPPTLFSKYGNTLPLLMIFMIFIFALLTNRREKRYQNQ
ncbi:MAG: apolipoprotein N-acyltransferase [Alphaproteobacteria bacterium]|nr:apolipoprotein N-acyltransferase [Alphaproteobacteria bacterium]